LLAYLGQQKAVEVRDLILNMPTVRKAAWQMFADFRAQGRLQDGIQIPISAGYSITEKSCRQATMGHDLKCSS
jgi:hypothetical protein